MVIDEQEWSVMQGALQLLTVADDVPGSKELSKAGLARLDMAAFLLTYA